MGNAIHGAVVRALFVLAILAQRTAHAAPGELADGTALPELRLSDVITVAVRQSPDLARARLDLDAARAQLLRAQGIEDTHLTADAQVDVTIASSNDPSGDTESESVRVGASRALPSGGTLSVSALGARDRRAEVTLGPDGMPQASVLSRYSAGLSLGLVQPLLRGAGSDAFRAPIHQAERQRDAAALTAEARARDVLVSLSQSYWQAAFAWRQLEIRKASLELAQKQLTYTESAIRAEKVPRSELLAVQQAIATRKQDILAGEQELYERSLTLRQVAGLEIGPDALAVRTELLPGKIEAADPELDAIVRDAYAHSAELAALEASRRAAEIAAAAADNAARSRLDLSVAAGPVGADISATDALTAVIRHPGFQIVAGLSGDHAIEHRTERGGQAAARAALLTAKIAERDARARLGVRVTRAVQRARAALASIALGDQAIDLAGQNVAAEQKRFELGKSTNFDVLRRQDELEQARLRQATAVVDYLGARAELDGLSGAILGRYHIVMP